MKQLPLAKLPWPAQETGRDPTDSLRGRAELLRPRQVPKDHIKLVPRDSPEIVSGYRRRDFRGFQTSEEAEEEKAKARCLRPMAGSTGPTAGSPMWV